MAIFDSIASTCCSVPAAVVALIRVEKAKYWRGFWQPAEKNTRVDRPGNNIITK